MRASSGAGEKPMNLDETKQKIARFLKNASPSCAADLEQILASSDLYPDHWLDSLLHLKLLPFLETEFGLRISAFQASRKNFVSVNNIAAFVQGLQNGG